MNDDECCNHNDIGIIAAENEGPENFSMEGSLREEPRQKKIRENKQKLRKELRSKGQGYTQHTSCNLVAPREIKQRCKEEACTRSNKKCNEFTDDNRKEICTAFYGMGNLSLQREYVTRHTKTETKKRKVTQNESSRRSNTVFYCLPLNGVLQPVCKVFFLNTLSVSEKTVRTALAKLQPTGVVEPEKRGGRRQSQIEKDTQQNEKIKEHINKFDRVESHYVRSDTTREYLHEDLNLSRMYRMFCSDYQGQKVPSETAYRNVSENES
ncbi:unnamed protein product [Phaedon cochleariae]|uniref:Uncharacterized protein n=1 Tax=Phaedon cochleariae TaxID=80249 RepID=A0A9N9SEW1_PHACE|nr:unnamed protein product [Phaedon cochleariae]